MRQPSSKNVKKHTKPVLKTNPYKTLRDKNKFLNRDKAASNKDDTEIKDSGKQRRIRVNHKDLDGDMKTESSTETTTYRYIPKRTYPTYKGKGGGRGGFGGGRGREKQKFKIHNEFHEDWLKYPNKDEEEDEMNKYITTSTEKENVDWYAESATEVVTNTIPYELMKDAARGKSKARRNQGIKSEDSSKVERSNVERRDRAPPKLSEDTTTSSINFATVFQPEIGLTSLFDLGSIKLKERKKFEPKEPSSQTQTPDEEESTEIDSSFFKKKPSLSKPSTTLTFAVDKAGIPKPKTVGTKLKKPKPRVKMAKKVPKKIKLQDPYVDPMSIGDKGTIVEVNRVRVLSTTEGPSFPLIKSTTTSPISPKRKAAIHRRLDRYSSQLGKKSKLATTTTTSSSISSVSSSRNRRLPPRNQERKSENSATDTYIRKPSRSRGIELFLVRPQCKIFL